MTAGDGGSRGRRNSVWVEGPAGAGAGERPILRARQQPGMGRAGGTGCRTEKAERESGRRRGANGAPWPKTGNRREVPNIKQSVGGESPGLSG